MEIYINKIISVVCLKALAVTEVMQNRMFDSEIWTEGIQKELDVVWSAVILAYQKLHGVTEKSHDKRHWEYSMSSYGVNFLSWNYGYQQMTGLHV